MGEEKPVRFSDVKPAEEVLFRDLGRDDVKHGDAENGSEHPKRKRHESKDIDERKIRDRYR